MARKMTHSILFFIFVTVVSSQDDACKSLVNINATDGIITSPNYHNYFNYTYPSYAKCRWTINVPEGKNIRFTFSTPMNVEVSNGCEYDWVAFFEGNRPTTTIICSKNNMITGPLCVDGIPPESFVLEGNHVDIEFCSDWSGEEKGFQLTFNATDEFPKQIPIVLTTPRPTTPPVVCGGNISIDEFETSEIFIETPNFPKFYPNNVNCNWYLTGPVGQVLIFTAETFSLEEIEFCNFDFLTISDVTGQAVRLGTFCGRTGPKNLRSIGNQVVVTFSSDYVTTSTGFRIRIKRSKCAIGEGTCPNSGGEEYCFRPDQLCDGLSDCPGSADEFCPPGCGTPAKKPILSTKNNKIIGGIEAKPNTWPWQAAMLTATDTQFCGGSIIDHHWLVTAAQCCNHEVSPEPSNYKVRVGEHDLEGSREPNAWTYDVERIIIHPQYGDSPAIHHDICLLKTVMPIFFNDDVYPVCLGSGVDVPVGTHCYVTGWGSGSISSRNVNISKKLFDYIRDSEVDKETEKKTEAIEKWKATNPLRQVDVKITTHDFCDSAYHGVVSEDMICAYNLGKDSCRGDNGGPLVCPGQWNFNTFELVGVVSWGFGCANEGIPGVYSRISHFLDWIAETVVNN